MKQVVLFVLIVMTTLTSLPSQSAACSCVPPAGVKEEMDRVDAVFRGTVGTIEEETSMLGRVTRSVQFQVEESWKGIDQTPVTLITGTAGGDCGYPFEEGKEYVVYAEKSDMFGSNSLSVSICSRTADIESAETDLAVLGIGSLPGEKGNGTDYRLPIFTGGVTLLIFWLLWRRGKH